MFGNGWCGALAALAAASATLPEGSSADGLGTDWRAIGRARRRQGKNQAIIVQYGVDRAREDSLDGRVPASIARQHIDR